MVASLLSRQLHMGKQAEEQQKFGERVSEPRQGVRTKSSLGGARGETSLTE